MAKLPDNPQGYCLPYYLIKGQVQAPEGATLDLNQYWVSLYKMVNGQPSQAITAQVKTVDGDFVINLYELYYAWGVPVHDDVKTGVNSDQYFLGVYQLNDYGFTPKNLVDLGSGLNNAEGFITLPSPLVLAKGEGQPQALTFALENGFSLPDAKKNVPYEYQLVVGGTKPYTATVSGLPDGIAFDGATGKLAGTAIIAGDYNFSITVTDSAQGSINGSFKIKVGDIVAPDGTVLLNISRNAVNDLTVSWTADLAPVIYFQANPESAAFSNSGVWDNALPAGVTVAGKTLTWPAALHQTYKGLFFKALTGGSLNADKLPDAYPVGKIDLSFAKDELKLLNIPLSGATISKALAGQVPAGLIKLYPRSGSGLNACQHNGDVLTGPDFLIAPTTGFWLRNSTGAELALTFVGAVPFETYSETLENLDLTGNPLPQPLTFSSGAVGDKLYPQSGTGLSAFAKEAAGWQGGEKELALGRGFWYRSGDGTIRKWTVDPKAGTAVIGK